jgi:multiple sugar transport system ATP-binding protein
MNTIKCVVEGNTLVGVGNNFRYPVEGNGSLGALEAAPEGTRANREVIFGVRSEAISITHNEDAPLRGRVLLREPLGDETIYTVDVGGATLMAKTPPRQMYTPGETVSLSIDPARTHLFDAASGQAVQRVAV